MDKVIVLTDKEFGDNYEKIENIEIKDYIFFVKFNGMLILKMVIIKQ